MTRGDKDSGRKVRYIRHRNYVKSGRYFTDLVAFDLDYSLGPYYQTLIESTNIPVHIRLSVGKVPDKNPSRFLKRLLSERKAELRLSGTSIAGNESLKRQIGELENMLRHYENEGVKPVNFSLTFRVFADHPAILRDNVNRIVSDLEMLGIRVKQVPVGRNTMIGLIRPGIIEKLKYLANTKQITTILPVFREPYVKPIGTVIGVDDLSERFVHLDPFSQNSYNMLILGETGSGKSFFGKLMVARNLHSGVAHKAIIFDPLNEYFCSFFDISCVEMDIVNYISVSNSSSERGELDRSGVVIVKATPEELDDETLVNSFMKALNAEMMNNKQEKTLIMLDECHIILKSLRNSKILGQMVRHSRHFNTAMINISQNTDDFLKEHTNSIAFNSNRIFVFRTRNLRESQLKVLKMDDFDVSAPERLMGGKLHPYSECLMTDGEFCRKIRVISTEQEDSRLQRF